MENVRSTSVLSKIHKMFLRFLFSQSQFDHLRYNSLTLALSQKTGHKSTRSYSFIANSLATQEFPVIADFIYWLSLHSCQNAHVLFVICDSLSVHMYLCYCRGEYYSLNRRIQPSHLFWFLNQTQYLTIDTKGRSIFSPTTP